MTSRIAAYVLLFSCCLASCAPSRLSPLPEGTLPPSHLGLRWAEIAAANKVQGSFSAIAQIDLQTDSVKRHLTIALQMQHPARLRIESLPLIGNPDFFLSLNDEHLKVFLPGRKEFYLGRPTHENLIHFLPFNLPPADIVATLMGIPCLPASDRIIGFRESTAGGSLRLELFLTNNEAQIMWFEGVTKRLVGMEILDSTGKIIHRVNYGAGHQFGNSRLPEEVTIVSREKSTRLHVQYTEMELLAPGDEVIFDLPIPPGLTPIILDGEDRQRIND